MRKPQHEATGQSGPGIIGDRVGELPSCTRERCQGWFVLPAAAWSRLVVLFVALVLVKVALLVGLHSHLGQIHGRIQPQPKTWLTYLAFYALVGLGISALLELDRRCQTIGVRAVRWLNAVILGLGLMLVLLTFRQGDKNYLYPILTGVLPWSSLVPYLSLDLFFRPPYLAAWLLGYVAAYYAMVRLGQEKHALRFTCVLAACYWAVGLRDFLERGDDLWVCVIYGLLTLLLLRCPDRVFHPAWWLVPVCWTLLIWACIAGEVKELARLSTYFVLLLSLIAVTFAVATGFALREGAGRTWMKVLPFFVLAFLLLSNSNHPLGAGYNNVIKMAARFPHYFLGELGVTGLVAVMAILYSRFRPRGGFWWLDVLGGGLILLALVDLRLTQVMGVRLGWDVIEFGNSPTMMWRLAKPYLPGFTIAVVAACSAYAVALWSIRWVWDCYVKGGEPDRAGLRWKCAVGCFALVAALGTIGSKPDSAGWQSVIRLAQSSPLGKWASRRVMSPAEFQRAAKELGMPELGMNAAFRTAPMRTNLNVLLILQESAINKHSSLFGGAEETQPLLAKYRDRMEIFPNFFSSFQGSIHARFATFTGLYPISDYNIFTLNPVPVKSLFEVMHEHGYACSMFYSSYADYTGFRSFLRNRGLEALYDADSMPGERKTDRVSWGLREEETLEAIRRQIRTRATSPQPFFLTYVPAAPHYPYDAIPQAFRKYPPGVLGDYSPFFLNEMLYMDWVMASILDELKETGLLDRTLVVITSDHGEMLGGAGKPVGHGWRVTPELANVPLILMDPDQRGYRVNTNIGSQVDILPTVLDVLGIALPPHELYQGRSLSSAPTNAAANRLVYLNSYKDYAVIEGSVFWEGEQRENSDSGDDSALTVYHISNDGPRTLFTVVPTNPKPTVSIERFRQFQESLLRNYTFYRDALRTDSARHIAQ